MVKSQQTPSAPPAQSSIDELRARLVHDVEALASLDRRTTTPGERESAQWIERRLRQVGASGVEVSTFRSQKSWVPTHLGHVLLGLCVGFLPGRLARAASAAVAVSYELDVSGRVHWLRRLLPAGTGVTVSATIDALERPERTVVLVAHHDAAHNGLVWHPRAVLVSRLLGRYTGNNLPSHLLAMGALSAAALPFRAARTGARALLSVAALLMTQSMRSYTTPGANDNASGVAVLLELARCFAQSPFTKTRVIFVFSGGEEAGSTGMRAWLRRAMPALDPDTTLVVNLDAIGSRGHLAVARREGLTTPHDRRDVDFARAAAKEEAIALRRVGIPNSTDAVTTKLAGLRTISLLSFEDGWISNLHLHSDTVDSVDWDVTEQAVTLTDRIVTMWDQESHGNA